MLFWLICYLNYHGYYFYPQNYINYNCENRINSYNEQIENSALLQRRKSSTSFHEIRTQSKKEKDGNNDCEAIVSTDISKKSCGATQPPLPEKKGHSNTSKASHTEKIGDRTLSNHQINQTSNLNQLKSDKKKRKAMKRKVRRQNQKLREGLMNNFGPNLSGTDNQDLHTGRSTNALPYANANIFQRKFSVHEPLTPEFIFSIDRAFNSEIDLMQSRLLTEASNRQVHTEDDLVVAKIYNENNQNIFDSVFEFIRTELVGWIGAYQQDGMDTPIFHNMTNKNSYMTIVCDNKYAYECAERCIQDISQIKSMASLNIVPLPPISTLVYCIDAKYEGLASDPEIFLTQLRLHKPKLYTDKWLVAAHDVCTEERRTYFIFLIDECSALALKFHYSERFFMCMHQLSFRSRGVVRDTMRK